MVAEMGAGCRDNMQTFARLFCVLTTIEREIGLDLLSSGERKIFYFLVEAAARGEVRSSEQILAQNFGSKSSVYRWLNILLEKKLIKNEIMDGQSTYELHHRLAQFSVPFAAKIKLSL